MCGVGVGGSFSIGDLMCSILYSCLLPLIIAFAQKRTSKGIWRQATVLKHRNSLQTEPMPCRHMPLVVHIDIYIYIHIHIHIHIYIHNINHIYIYIYIYTHIMLYRPYTKIIIQYIIVDLCRSDLLHPGLLIRGLANYNTDTNKRFAMYVHVCRYVCVCVYIYIYITSRACRSPSGVQASSGTRPHRGRRCFIHVYIYIYIHRERERSLYLSLYVCIYIYIYIMYTYIHTYTHSSIVYHIIVYYTIVYCLYARVAP